MFIRSERLFLRPSWPEDWEELHALIDDREVVHNLARAPWPYTAGDARAFVRLPQDPLAPHFLVSLPTAEGERLIGAAGLGRDGDAVELGYWIGREHWGRGYATEAASAVLEVASALGHRRIIAGHFADNPASGRVLRKAGFRPTGEVRQRLSLGRGREVESVCYAIELPDFRDCDVEGEGGKPDRMAA